MELRLASYANRLDIEWINCRGTNLSLWEKILARIYAWISMNFVIWNTYRQSPWDIKKESVQISSVFTAYYDGLVILCPVLESWCNRAAITVGNNLWKTLKTLTTIRQRSNDDCGPSTNLRCVRMCKCECPALYSYLVSFFYLIKKKRCPYKIEISCVTSKSVLHT